MLNSNRRKTSSDIAFAYWKDKVKPIVDIYEVVGNLRYDGFKGPDDPEEGLINSRYCSTGLITGLMMNHDYSTVFKDTYNNRDNIFQAYGGCEATFECGQYVDNLDDVEVTNESASNFNIVNIL